jgi:hypothetical protein
VLTCPRCQELCPHDAKWCAECGCALQLTEGDYRRLQLTPPGIVFVREWEAFIDGLPETP